MRCAALTLLLAIAPAGAPCAQTPPSAAEMAAYAGLHAAAARGGYAGIVELLVNGLDPEARDGNGRTPLHVAAFMGDGRAIRALAAGGADLNALDHQAYDIVTILAVRNDLANLDLALSLGASARNITSPWRGTALIAAAHLGHDGAVRRLIAAGAPLDHVNSLNWTALIEAIVLGDGGARHVACVRALAEAGADLNLADRDRATPLTLARGRGHREIAAILEAAGAR